MTSTLEGGSLGVTFSMLLFFAKISPFLSDGRFDGFRTQKRQVDNLGATCPVSLMRIGAKGIKETQK
jgi:hypothetical protein